MKKFFFTSLILSLFTAANLSVSAKSFLDNIQIDKPEWKKFQRPPLYNDWIIPPPPEAQAKKFFFRDDNTGLIICGYLDQNGKAVYENDPKAKAALYNNKGVDMFRKIPEDTVNYQKNLEKLYRYFKQGTYKGPLFFPFRYNLAVISLRLKKYLKAKIQYEKAYNLIPKYWGSLLGMGKALELLGKDLEAVDCYKRAFKLNPFDYEASVALGNYYFKEKLYTKASRYYNYVNKKKPGFPDAIIGLGKIAYIRKNYYESSLIFSRIRLKTPAGKPIPYNREMHYYLARSYFEIEEYKLAVREYNKILAHPEDPFFIGIPYTTVERLRNMSKQFARIKALMSR